MFLILVLVISAHISVLPAAVIFLVPVELLPEVCVHTYWEQLY